MRNCIRAGPKYKPGDEWFIKKSACGTSNTACDAETSTGADADEDASSAPGTKKVAGKVCTTLDGKQWCEGDKDMPSDAAQKLKDEKAAAAQQKAQQAEDTDSATEGKKGKSALKTVHDGAAVKKYLSKYGNVDFTQRYKVGWSVCLSEGAWVFHLHDGADENIPAFLEYRAGFVGARARGIRVP